MNPSLLSTLLLLLILLLPLHSVSLTQEGLYLLEAKRGLDDPNGALADWNPRDSTPCNWTGVYCSRIRTVTSLDLSNLDLAGPFPASLCRLPKLSFLSLFFNSINSTLPPSSLLPCSSLSHLDLSQNLLVGILPSSLPLLPKLAYLDLSGNNFSGPIPPSFSQFPQLEALSLVSNLLNSKIPSFLSNISTLRQLNLSYNPFAPGILPASFANLSNLEVLWLSGCNLVGPIPASLGRLSKLTDLDLSSNNLSGAIPESLTSLNSAVQIELYGNNLSGHIPSGFGNLTSLRRFDAATNQLDGRIPADIFLATLLDSLHLYENRLTGEIPGTVSQSKNLADLRLFSNGLTGTLPARFGKNSPLVFLDLSDNLLSGEIPAGICDGGMLQQLLLLDNSFSGSLPESLGRCRTLFRIRLANNRLSGEVPAAIWGLPHVSLLELAGNNLFGGISSSISGATNLSKLVISNNQFSGSIPSEIGSLRTLYEFSAASNRLSGSLPELLGSLAELGKLDLHDNSLSGELLRGIHSWKKLSELNLANNSLSGSIPPELGDLPVLNYLDLSGNALTGDVPSQLQNLKLNKFNLSNNRLSGLLPPLFVSNAYRSSFVGNPGLCGDLAGLCPTLRGGQRAHNGIVWLVRLFLVLAAFILIAGSGWFYWKYQNYKEAKLKAEKSRWTLTSFHKLGFSEYEILKCLDEDNMIGSGASGKVYKVVLSNGEVVAVKKLWGTSKKGTELPDESTGDVFEAEVTTLGKVRHKNIVKLWCCCTCEDSKLLVYEYMPNGSLGDLLHSNKGGLLDWPTRYKIALDAAEGLSYLHHDCVPPIVHRDVKSNNILLDGEFGAKVADFGVAKTVEDKEKGQKKSMSVIAGSCGYIAPEYAYTLRVNEKSDIYSFGVVILELVTGKRPVDHELGEKDLVKWVYSTLEQKGIDHVLDPKLNSCFKKEICKVVDIGLLCTSSLPINRPSMRKVVKLLLDVSPLSKPKPEKKDGTRSPYYLEDSSDQGSMA